MAPTLGYWDIRGLVAPIRYLLVHAGVNYDEKLYTCGPPPTFGRPEWLAEKFSLGLDFPNLPYYIDGDVKLSQSSVILRYLAKKFGLAGQNEAEQLRAELAHEQVKDYHMDYARVVYNPQFLTLKEDYLKALPDKMKLLSNFLGEHKWVAGNNVTFADFVLFEFLEGQSYFVDDLLKDYPNLEQYYQRALKLEGIEKYFKSPNAIKYPFNGGPAYFGGPFSDQLSKSA